jgi:hypothetical protein
MEFFAWFLFFGRGLHALAKALSRDAMLWPLRFRAMLRPLRFRAMLRPLRFRAKLGLPR